MVTRLAAHGLLRPQGRRSGASTSPLLRIAGRPGRTATRLREPLHPALPMGEPSRALAMRLLAGRVEELWMVLTFLQGIRRGWHRASLLLARGIHRCAAEHEMVGGVH